MIELVDVEKSYRGKHRRIPVLNGITATFDTRDSIGILGHNGAGKSTLLRLVSGAERPNHGLIRRTSTISWPLGFSGSFSASLSGAENLRFVARIYGADIDEVTRFVADFSELGRAMEEPIRTYSTGMRSRLAFALSMAIDFEVYIIDEALAVGDSAFQAKCEAIFAERKARSSVIMASHSIDMIKQYCTRAAVLHGGRLKMFDDIDLAYAYYQELPR